MEEEWEYHSISPFILGEFVIFLNEFTACIWSLYSRSSQSRCILFSYTLGHVQWQNMTLAGMHGVQQGTVGKSCVSVLVDHF